MIGVSLALAVWAAVAFGRIRTTIIPRRPPSSLVTLGPYRHSRNPIYVADMGVLIGWALILGSPFALVLTAALPPILTRRFILQEEATLREAFGMTYEEYCERVRRWV